MSTQGNPNANQCQVGRLECDATESATTWWGEINIKEHEKFDQRL